MDSSMNFKLTQWPALIAEKTKRERPKSLQRATGISREDEFREEFDEFRVREGFNELLDSTNPCIQSNKEGVLAMGSEKKLSF
ncbi:hypothetical protein TSUD_30120 [Trifolium subterraneum]|uniref:Uncharacterized protein n=1 Tax=Trifolium subterraneum TaxID=3900 RepID=A0A2Z6MS42_TRISU|nr:hypothetical protein TSUD_30120 [Trifolium subterraneum]